MALIYLSTWVSTTLSVFLHYADSDIIVITDSARELSDMYSKLAL